MFNVFFSNQNPWDLSLDHGRTCLERNLLFTRGPDTDVVNTVAFIVMTLVVLVLESSEIMIVAFYFIFFHTV